jgi:hypothetical protein
MDRSEGNRSNGNPNQVCLQCGGSGVLRTHATAYRTCLDCVGQGLLPRFDTSGLLPPATAWRRRHGWTGGFRGDLSAWTSGAR